MNESPAKNKPTRKPKKGSTGKRYPESVKMEAVKYATAQGRGGKSKAMKKFKVSYIALASWFKKYGNGSSTGKPIKAGDTKALLKAIESKRQELKGLLNQLLFLQ